MERYFGPSLVRSTRKVFYKGKIYAFKHSDVINVTNESVVVRL